MREKGRDVAAAEGGDAVCTGVAAGDGAGRKGVAILGEKLVEEPVGEREIRFAGGGVRLHFLAELLAIAAARQVFLEDGLVGVQQLDKDELEVLVSQILVVICLQLFGMPEIRRLLGGLLRRSFLFGVVRGRAP